MSNGEIVIKATDEVLDIYQIIKNKSDVVKLFRAVNQFRQQVHDLQTEVETLREWKQMHERYTHKIGDDGY